MFKKIILLSAVLLGLCFLALAGCTYNPNSPPYDLDNYECRYGTDHEHPRQSNFWNSAETERYYKCMEARGWEGRPGGDMLLHSLFDK